MSAVETQETVEVHHVDDTGLRRTDSHRAVFIGPRLVALTWFVAVAIVIAINPATAEPIQPTLALTILGNLAAFAFYGTIIAGLVGGRFTDRIGMTTGALMLAGHMVCGLDGHLPMTSTIWIGQLGLIAVASVISGLAFATRA